MSRDRVEEAFFHENLHRGLHEFYGEEVRDIAEKFWETTSPTNPEATEKHKQQITDEYREEPENIKEEYLVHVFAYHMSKGSVDNLMRRLSAEHQSLINDILNRIRYDRSREARERKEKPVLGEVQEGRKANSERNADRGRISEHKSRIAQHIDNLLNKLGTKNRTTVYHSLDEVPEEMRKHIEQRHKQGKKVRGWYENGQVYLFLPDIESEYQAEKTIWHETVAHHGLRELIGAENYDKLLRQLWLEHRDGDMGKWVTEAMMLNGWNLNKAIDEYLAREAEKANGIAECDKVRDSEKSEMQKENERKVWWYRGKFVYLHTEIPLGWKIPRPARPQKVGLFL